MDAMAVRGLDPEDEYSVISNTVTVEDAARKHLYSVPQYILNIQRRKPQTPQLGMVRVVYCHRDDLQPYQQDIYDNEGNLETQVFYSGYRDFDSAIYPSLITIKRPVEEIQIVLTVEKVTENQTLKDDQFVVTVPEGTQTQHLE